MYPLNVLIQGNEKQKACGILGWEMRFTEKWARCLFWLLSAIRFFAIFIVSDN